MGIRPRTYNEMVADAVSYLSNNTNITYLEPGSTARALLDATMLEVAKLQDFVVTNFENSFLSNAKGPYLDIIGNSFGIARKLEGRAKVYKEDAAIRFYVRSGTLGQRLPHPTDTTKGLIPANTTLSNPDGTAQYSVSEDTIFPINSKSVYVDAIASSTGSAGNLGVNQLTVNSLNISDVYSTNDITITVGSDQESDDAYRYRISKAFTTKFGATSAAIATAANSIAGVSISELVPFARGAGTFDVLLVPRGNRLSKSTKDQALRAIESVTAYGISAKIKEPEYVPICITAKLRFAPGTEQGQQNALKDLVQSVILNFLSGIRIGGELVINQLKAAILNTNQQILDVTILELCIDNRPRGIRDYKLASDELFIPDELNSDPIQVL